MIISSTGVNDPGDTTLQRARLRFREALRPRLRSCGIARWRTLRTKDREARISPRKFHRRCRSRSYVTPCLVQSSRRTTPLTRRENKRRLLQPGQLRPPTRQPAMQCQDVTKQRDQCPRLLWIPSPKSAPGIICPDSTEDCSSSQQQDTELKYAIKPKMHRRVRACGCGIPRVSPEQNMPETHCQRESRITQRDGEHMNGQPKVVAQHRDQRINACGHGNRYLMHEQQRRERDR